jgi:hypothetical protein
VVVYNDPLSVQLYNERLTKIPVVGKLGYALPGTGIYLFVKNQLGGDQIYYAGDLEKSVANLNVASTNPGSFRLVVPGKEAMVTDFGVNSLLQKILPPDLVQKDLSPTPSEIVLTLGHKDQSYLNFVRSVRDTKMLKDKIWVSYSCYDAGDALLATRVIRDNEARAVFYFGDAINPYATRAVVQEYQKLAHQQDGNVLEKLRIAIQNAKKTVPSLSTQLDKIYNTFIYQISFQSNDRYSKNKAA